MKPTTKIFVAGHRGMVGSAIVRKLTELGYTNIITIAKIKCNLIDQLEVDNFFNKQKPDYVFLAAAKVGGIKANNEMKGDFIYENIMIQSNIIKSSKDYNVKKLIFLGSSCIYPKMSPQPIKEEYLLTGPLEETNSAYAIAKIAGIELIKSFRKEYGRKWISLMPTNLYGPRDNFELQGSHVLPAFIRRFVEAQAEGRAKETLWGTGSPMREFLHVDDLASAVVLAGQRYDSARLHRVLSACDHTWVGSSGRRDHPDARRKKPLHCRHGKG